MSNVCHTPTLSITVQWLTCISIKGNVVMAPGSSRILQIPNESMSPVRTMHEPLLWRNYAPPPSYYGNGNWLEYVSCLGALGDLNIRLRGQSQNLS